MPSLYLYIPRPSWDWQLLSHYIFCAWMISSWFFRLCQQGSLLVMNRGLHKPTVAVLGQGHLHGNITWNPSIYNILRWVAWTMGQTNCWPRVWCSKYYFFIMISCKILCKSPFNLFSYFFIKLQNENKDFWVP